MFVRDTQTGTTTRVSVATDGTQGNDESSEPAISADGRYIAFHSSAGNLVPDDTNGAADVFVRDTRTGTTTRVSVATDGTPANDRSRESAISADGRYIAFESSADNLVPDQHQRPHRRVRPRHRDRHHHRVSVVTDGTQSNGNSQHAGQLRRRPLHRLPLPGLDDLAPDDTNDAPATCSSATPGRAPPPRLGRHRRHPRQRLSQARAGHLRRRPLHRLPLLVPTTFAPDDTNGRLRTVFVRGTRAGTTTRGRLATDGTPANERLARTSRPSPPTAATSPFQSSGRQPRSPTTPTGRRDVFVRDTRAGTTTRGSVATDGTPTNDNSVRAG
ncbi:MAG: hypothetical protein U5R31_05265 [Acidimicrobiia bacterium]|nr:hypothetical protein [Acidimicrobiia bacterium]